MIAAVLLGLATALSLVVLTVRGELVRGELVRGDRPWRWLPVALVTLLMAGAGLATALGSHLTGRAHAAFVVVGLLGAAVGGSQVTSAVFEAIDDTNAQEAAAQDTGAPDTDLRSAGQVLRGGAWIGVLERIAVLAALVARWPEGIAIVLAVKGLGRYPELRSGTNPSLAERFIIGTLVSVLWAALCAYAASGPALG
jgi:hypothetical protein